jgi:hypothetical protein
MRSEPGRCPIERLSDLIVERHRFLTDYKGLTC